MKKTETRGLRRVLLGAILGAVLAPAVVWLLSLFLLPSEAQAIGSAGFLGAPRIVTASMADAFGSLWLAALVQSQLGCLFGGVAALATLPFADDGRELVLRSLAHFGMTAAAFALLLGVCRWVDWDMIPVWLFLLTVLYLLIWLGRWVGWYMEVAQIRALLGLEPGPTPLKWRETLPYLPFALLMCLGLPLLLRGFESVMSDIPVLTQLLYPYLLLPAAALCSGVSLGKRQGVCPVYPAVCFVLTWLMARWFIGYPLPHALIGAVPALLGNILGWLYRRAVPRSH